MPTYDFECPRCEHRFERYALMEDRHNQRCPVCRARANILIINAPAGQVWQPDWFYVNSNEKVFCSSKAQLFEECRKRGKYSVSYGQENSLGRCDADPADGGLQTVHEVVKQEDAFWDNADIEE